MKLIKRHPLISTSIILFLCCEFYVLVLEKFKLPIPSYVKIILNSPYAVLIFLIGVPISYFAFKFIFTVYSMLVAFIFDNKYYKNLIDKEKYWLDRASKAYHYNGDYKNLNNYKKNNFKK